MNDTNYHALMEKIGYIFKDEAIFTHALTHSSFSNETKMPKLSDNERLEFLGDAVLELVSSDFLYRNYPDYPEGEMSKLRAALVCEPTLADVSKSLGIPDFIRMSIGEEKTGGRDLKSITSDALEAVIGAIYLDGGIEPAREFILKYILTDIEERKLFHDSKTVLQEKIQGKNLGKLAYVETEESGPDHNKTFCINATLNGKIIGRGTGHSKKAAEQEAAYNALKTCKLF